MIFLCDLFQVLHKPTAVQDIMWDLFISFLLELFVQHSGSREVGHTPGLVVFGHTLTQWVQSAIDRLSEFDS